MSEPSAEELARLRARADQGIWFDPKDARHLFAQVDRLTEALEAQPYRILGDRHLLERAERAEADLADEKRRRAGLRAGVEAVVARMKTRQVDHRHEDEEGAASPFGIDGRAYFYAGDIYDDYEALCALLDTATEETGTL